MYIVGKYKIYLETGGKANIWRACLACFGTIFVSTMCVFWVYYACQNVNNKSQILLKRAETTIIPTLFKGVLWHVRAILVPFLTVRSTCIRYQEIVILKQDDKG
jgi:hypothetical protein